MLKLSKNFENPFDDRLITDPRIIDFATAHIIQLNLHNTTHAYDGIIASTTTKNDDLKTITGTELETKGDQFSSTILVYNYKKQFVLKVRNAKSLVLSQYAPDSVVFKEFFPFDWSYYGQPKINDINDINDHFIAKFGSHSEFGPAATAMVTAFTNLQTSFNLARQVQLNNMGEVKSLIPDTSVERQELNLQLFANVHTLALAYPDQPEMASVFFDESKLFPHTYGGESKIGTIHKFDIPIGKTINTHFRGITDKTIRVIDLSNERVGIFTVSSLKNPIMPTETLIMEEPSIKNVDACTLGDDPTNGYMMIVNLSTNVANISIEITGKIKGSS